LANVSLRYSKVDFSKTLLSKFDFGKQICAALSKNFKLWWFFPGEVFGL
jgi:hypothetical protein